MSYADLHLHTTCSDGILTPAELVTQAIAKGFSAISITDHDTTSGLDEAFETAATTGLEVIPGLELSTLEGEREIHLLGYYPDRHNRDLQLMLEKIIGARKNRALYMIQKLNDLGCDLSLDRVKEIADSQFIGRPHIARAMLEKGYIKEASEAFSEAYIGRGGRAYVERFKLTPAEGIKLLQQAGAITVLAHPGFLSKGEPVTEAEITALIQAGLRGIEVFYSRHSVAQTAAYYEIATRRNLLITGGSDCHGQQGETNNLGSIKLLYNYVEELKSVRSECLGINLPPL